MSARWLIAGLGNPGAKYDRTRHNAGFWLLDALDRRQPLNLKPNRKLHGAVSKEVLAGADCVFLKPDTFMNNSGQAIRAATDYYQIAPEHVVIAYDDLDLPPGVVRLKQGGGHGGHNGLRSTFQHLGSQGFWRLRIGIGHPGLKEAVTPWVLSRANAADAQAILASIDRAVAILPELLSGQPERAMQSLHTLPAANP
ncbi:MAG: aminoacyl-tRNA hydrolase [Wenzhouxiangella sp.]|nr:aminoacyl-tRNA hydrolase [Wenzhouxiangella sp.]